MMMHCVLVAVTICSLLSKSCSMERAVQRCLTLWISANCACTLWDLAQKPSLKARDSLVFQIKSRSYAARCIWWSNMVQQCQSGYSLLIVHQMKKILGSLAHHACYKVWIVISDSLWRYFERSWLSTSQSVQLADKSHQREGWAVFVLDISISKLNKFQPKSIWDSIFGESKGLTRHSF